jgi:hypothetical protein
MLDQEGPAPKVIAALRDGYWDLPVGRIGWILAASACRWPRRLPW